MVKRCQKVVCSWFAALEPPSGKSDDSHHGVPGCYPCSLCHNSCPYWMSQKMLENRRRSTQISPHTFVVGYSTEKDPIISAPHGETIDTKRASRRQVGWLTVHLTITEHCACSLILLVCAWREDLQTHRFMGLRKLLHTVFTYTIWRNLYRTWIRSCVWRSADLTQKRNSKIALSKSVEFIETCSIAQYKKLESPLFFTKETLTFVNKIGSATFSECLQST